MKSSDTLPAMLAAALLMSGCPSPRVEPAPSPQGWFCFSTADIFTAGLPGGCARSLSLCQRAREEAIQRTADATPKPCVGANSEYAEGVECIPACKRMRRAHCFHYVNEFDGPGLSCSSSELECAQLRNGGWTDTSVDKECALAP